MLSPARNSPRRWRRRIRGLIVNQFLCCQVDVFRTAVGLLVGCRAWKNFPRIPPPSNNRRCHARGSISRWSTISRMPAISVRMLRRTCCWESSRTSARLSRCSWSLNWFSTDDSTRPENAINMPFNGGHSRSSHALRRGQIIEFSIHRSHICDSDNTNGARVGTRCARRGKSVVRG